jgi:hypothetical protein
MQYYEARTLLLSENEIAFACRNITQRVNALAREKFLSHATQLLSSSLDYQVTIHNLIGLIVPALADYSVIRILNESGKVERLEAKCGDGEKESVFYEIVTRYSRLEKVQFASSRAISEGKSILNKKITPEYLRRTSDTDEQFHLTMKLRPVSSISVPLIFDKKILGSIHLGSVTAWKTFSELDLALLEDLAGRAVMAIQRARTYDKLLRAVDLKDRIIGITRQGIEKPFSKMDQEISKLLPLTSQIDDQTLRRQIVTCVKSLLRFNEEIGAKLDEVREVTQVWSGENETERSPQHLGMLIKSAVDDKLKEAEQRQIRVDANFDSAEVIVLCNATLVERAYKDWISAVFGLMPRNSVLRLHAKREGKSFVFSTMIPLFGSIESQLSEQKGQIEFTGADVSESFIDAKTYMAVFVYSAFTLN